MMYVDTTSIKGTHAHKVETQRQHRVIQHMHAVNTSKSKFPWPIPTTSFYHILLKIF